MEYKTSKSVTGFRNHMTRNTFFNSHARKIEKKALDKEKISQPHL